MESAVSYVSQAADGSWRLTGSRISLDSVVHEYREGRTPEAIAEDFPTLSLEQIHGAIAFYLRNRGEIDGYLADQEGRWERLRRASESAHGPLLDRLQAAFIRTSSQPLADFWNNKGANSPR